jgi:hypothetical protein
MTPFILATALSILAADAGPATTAAATPAAEATAPKSAGDDMDRVICKNQPITGSRFVKRICMKKSEWSDTERRTEEQTRRFGERAATGAAMATGGGLTNGN